jgi:hypothetical protein
MKPKPLESLNHLTVPVTFILNLFLDAVNIPAKKAGRTAVRQKKSAGN